MKKSDFILFDYGTQSKEERDKKMKEYLEKVLGIRNNKEENKKDYKFKDLIYNKEINFTYEIK